MTAMGKWLSVVMIACAVPTVGCGSRVAPFREARHEQRQPVAGGSRAMVGHGD